MSSFLQGAPEGILERCSFVRINGKDKVPMTTEIKEQILQLVRKYGTGQFSIIMSLYLVGWPSGLRRWFKAPVISMAWVRIPPLP